MTTPLTLTPGRRSDGTAVLAAVGEIDMSNTHELAVAIDSTTGPLVLDLSGDEYLDSAGLSVLFSRAGRIELVASPLLDPVLAISGLTDLIARSATGRGAGGDAAGPGR
ncbi:STAS domain-containing protein [Kitasatospora phosalacinea]|uniref:STAS domain-containing protein n=1 Tax=Kitasatospora phosalacinea TaxID=2065 RepID=UPI00052479BE|nr:STAS domain-containing protein [Kitasatospora phosalacinea]